MSSGALENSTSLTRAILLQTKNEQILASKETYRKLLADLFAAIEDIARFSEIGAGQRHRTISPGSERETRLQTFIEKFTIGGHSISELDLNIPMQSPTAIDQDTIEESITPISFSLEENSSAPTVQMHVDDVVDQAKLIFEAKEIPRINDLATNQEAELDTPFSSLNVSPPARDEMAKLECSNPSTKTDSPVTDGTFETSSQAHSSKPFPSPRRLSPVYHNILTLSPQKEPRTRLPTLLLDGATHSPQSNSCIAEDYVQNLPPIPASIINSRLLGAQLLPPSNFKNWRRQAARSGLWVGPANNELTKLSIKNQHIGVKTALGISDNPKIKTQSSSARLRNVVTSADWKTIYEELKMTKTLEAIEQKKAEKTWSYTQPKKPRFAHIKKAHWDYVLDEMSWLQIDYRQERRWKIATAYQLAHKVVEWHQADVSGRKALQASFRKNAEDSQVPFDESDLTNPSDAVDVSNIAAGANEDLSPYASSKNSPETYRFIKSLKSDANDCNLDSQTRKCASTFEVRPLSQQSEPRKAKGNQDLSPKNTEPPQASIDEADQMNVTGSAYEPKPSPGSNEDISPYPSRKNSPEAIRSMKSLKGSTTNDSNLPFQSRKGASAIEGRSSSHHHEFRKLHRQATLARMNIFKIPPHQTTIKPDQTLMAVVSSVPNGRAIECYTLHKIFNDLPLFGDLDSLSAKRADEASPYHGRITRIAKNLESKPLLVSTLKPSSNVIGHQWKDLSSIAFEDLRELPEGRTESVHHSHLFSGRKYREFKELHGLTAPISVPIETMERSVPLVWSTADEERLQNIYAGYNSNWSLVADVFNATASGSTIGKVTPRDCRDCWTRLNPPPIRLSLLSKSAGQAEGEALPAESSDALFVESTDAPHVEPSDALLVRPTDVAFVESLASPHVESTTGPLAESSGDPLVGLVAGPPPEITPPEPVPAEVSIQQETVPEPDSNTLETQGKRSATFLFPPAKRVSREAARYEITQRVKEQRTADLPKLLPPGQPRQISLNAHETHAHGLRAYMSPLEMSAVKAERDRQTQVTLEMAKRQHQMHNESLLNHARAAALRNGASPANGGIPARIVSQSPVSQNRSRTADGGSLHRQTNLPLRYGVGSGSSPSSGRASSPNTMSQHGVQLPLGNPSASLLTQLQQQLPSIPQAFQSHSNLPSLASSGAAAVTTGRAPSVSPQIPNISHSSNLSRNVTSSQIAQFLQQQRQQQRQELLELPLHLLQGQMQNHQPLLPHQIYQAAQAQAQLQQQLAPQLCPPNSQQQTSHTPSSVPGALTRPPPGGGTKESHATSSSASSPKPPSMSTGPT